jgi:catechol 2,3-dioxygenase-like lactoylglutathione lyase family enzyme
MQGLKSAFLIAAGCGMLSAGTADAPGPAIGVRAIIHSVANLDKTVAFYRDGLGMQPVGPGGKPVTTMPTPQPLDESLLKFTDTAKGAKFRNASFNIPGAAFMLELTEFTGTPRKKSIPHMQDPGAATLVLTVLDVDAALAGVKKNGGSVLSIGGEPMKIGGEASQNRSVFVRDPDGFMLELASAPPSKSSATAKGNILGGRIGVTIKDTDQTMKFYHDVLGFETKPAPVAYQTNKTIASLIDAKGAEWRISSAKIPGTSVNFELLEFKDVARKPFDLRVPDPGSPAVSIHVKNVESAMKAVAAGGGSIVTRGGEPVTLGAGMGVFVRDPNGLLIELIP